MLAGEIGPASSAPSTKAKRLARSSRWMSLVASGVFGLNSGLTACAAPSETKRAIAAPGSAPWCPPRHQAGFRLPVGEILNHHRGLGQHRPFADVERRHVAVRVDGEEVAAVLERLPGQIHRHEVRRPGPASQATMWGASEQAAGLVVSFIVSILPLRSIASCHGPTHRAASLPGDAAFMPRRRPHVRQVRRRAAAAMSEPPDGP